MVKIGKLKGKYGYYCIIKKSDYLFSQYEENEDKKLKFMKDVFKIISMGEKDDTAPYLNTFIY